MQNNPSTRVKISREVIRPTLKPSFDQPPAEQLATQDIQQLKEILVAKELEICLLKRQIHQLKKSARHPMQKPVTRTLYQQPPQGISKETGSRGQRHNRVFSIGEYRPDELRAKRSPDSRSHHYPK